MDQDRTGKTTLFLARASISLDRYGDERLVFKLRLLDLAFILILVSFIAVQIANVSLHKYQTVLTRRLLERKCTKESYDPVSFIERKFQAAKEVRHILFLKTHKAASGTASSVFFRFGVTRNLTFVLPKFINMVSMVDPIKDKYIYPRLKKPFDIIASHMIYDRDVVKTYMKKDTVYIGILRDPFQQFISSVHYMRPDYVFKLSKTFPVHEYLKDPMKHEKANTNGPRFSWLNNRQAVEFGFPDDVVMTKNKSAIDLYIRRLDKEFSVVLITEYFDESIILLRRLFNWSIKDVLYRRLHIGGWDRKLTLPKPHDRLKFRSWAAVDYALYDFFFKRLWQQIRQAGSDFTEELLHFKKIRAEVDDYCKVTPNDSYNVPGSKWNAAFVIDLKFCKLMFSEEEDFVKIIAQNQYGIKQTKKK